jgi:MGT family glycosyltransferase
MATLLAYTSPARGHLYPLVPSLLELQRRGHRVVVRTMADEIDRLLGLGFEAGPIAPEIEEVPHNDYSARTPIGALRLGVRTFAARARIEVPDVQAAIEAERPDALLIDVSTWGAATVAEASALPWAYTAHYPLPVSSVDAPPFGPGFAPRSDAVGRVRDAVARRAIMRPLERIVLNELGPLRADHGLRPVSSADDLYGNTAPLVVCFTAEPFEYPRRDWPSSFRLVGPGIWDPPDRDPEFLAELTRPLVLVTGSTEFQDDGALTKTALEALADEDVDVVATTAGVDPGQFHSPPNARVVRFAAHRPLLERAACVVCHAGMGITQKALWYGVPVCAVPFGRDQLEVAQRVVTAGAGTRLSASRLRPDRLRERVREARGRADGAGRIAAAYRAAGGADAAASAFESLVR